MRTKGLLALCLLCAAMLVSGCVSQSLNPLLKNEATDVPGLAMNVHPASAGEQNVDQVAVTLYFRYQEEPMLAPESRILTVQRDQSVELAIVRALLDGPSAGHSDLKRLLPSAATVESVTSRDDILFVTFDEGLLRDDIPENWAQDPQWKDEAPLQRRLAMQSVAASITEQLPYTGVQILLHRQDQLQTNLRLENSYFLTGDTSLSEPIQRDETLLLTPHATVATLLAAWQAHDFERLYRYVSSAERPPYATALEAFSTFGALAQYTATPGSVAADGQRAVVTVDLRILQGGAQAQTSGYPLQLVRESGIWKISYTQLLALMAR